MFVFCVSPQESDEVKRPRSRPWGCSGGKGGAGRGPQRSSCAEPSPASGLVSNLGAQWGMPREGLARGDGNILTGCPNNKDSSRRHLIEVTEDWTKIGWGRSME